MRFILFVSQQSCQQIPLSSVLHTKHMMSGSSSRIHEASTISSLRGILGSFNCNKLLNRFWISQSNERWMNFDVVGLHIPRRRRGISLLHIVDKNHRHEEEISAKPTAIEITALGVYLLVPRKADSRVDLWITFTFDSQVAELQTQKNCWWTEFLGTFGTKTGFPDSRGFSIFIVRAGWSSCCHGCHRYDDQ